MAKPRLDRIGVVVNLEKQEAVALAKTFVPTLVAAGFNVCPSDDLRPILDDPVHQRKTAVEDCDLVVAIGGDGTILQFARQFVDSGVPILGLKAGRLGFLTEGRIDMVVDSLKAGRFTIQDRMRIVGAVRNNGETIREFNALNDIVVHVSGFSRMARLRTEVAGKLMREYSADGIIIATPTGSTAYSLSAGGPLVEPTLHAMILTPLSPHTMSIRPLVVDADHVVTIRIASEPSNIRVTADGQEGAQLEAGQYLEVMRSEQPTRLVIPDDYDFFQLLREKL